MNVGTEAVLQNMLYSGGEKDFMFVVDLFDAYSTREITSVEDLFADHKPFVEFVKKHKNAFEMEDRDISVYFANRRIHALKKLNYEFFYPQMRKHLFNFSKEVELLVGDNKDVKILEVGGGHVPYSSILLGQDGYYISAMDDIFLSEACLSNLKVKSFRQMFNTNVSLKDVDLLVARRPCSAIREIVEACSEQKVPYFMRLCACELPDEDLKLWQPILRRLDQDIEFKDAYAYNFKNSKFGSPEDISSIIEMDTDKDMY